MGTIVDVAISFSSPIYHPSYFSEDDFSLYFLGSLHGEDTIDTLRKKISSNGILKTPAELANILRSIAGNFCFVAKDREGRVFACVDKIRSYPLFYSTHARKLRMSISFVHMKSNAEALTKDRHALIEFALAGYVTGGGTIYQEIKQLQAGQFLYFANNSVQVYDYYLFYNPTVCSLTTHQAMQLLEGKTRFVFKSLIDRLGGRPVLIPLSAGLDSRFILCMLKMLGYQNIRAFSYGVKGNHEASGASQVARALGVEWTFIPYTRTMGKNFFISDFYQEYVRFSHCGAMLPPVMDILALIEMQRFGFLPKDAVVINGQTGDFISGNHIPKKFGATTRINKTLLLDAIIQKHYGFWTHLHTPENIAMIKSRIQKNIPFFLKDSLDRDEAMKLYELWEWRARQATHVVNGQRAYDFMGLSWELPLWHDSYLTLWSQFSFVLKFRQQLYRDFLETLNPYGLFRRVHYPVYMAPTSTRLLQRMCVVFGSRKQAIAQHFLSYWQNFSYYYAIYPYREYLKYARFHRQAGSYHVKHLLEQEYGESIFN